MFLMRGTYITALVIAFGLIAWLLSGMLGRDNDVAPPESIAQANELADAVDDDKAPTRVRARIFEAQDYARKLVIRGRTENKRTVMVKAETAGKIIDRPIERGSRVAAGDLLCRISLDDRDAAQSEANEALNQAKIDFDGALKLHKRGLVSDSAIAAAKTRLASAETSVKRTNVEVNRTSIRAPFAGLVDDIHAEIGDYVSPGTACATVVDLDPMLLIGAVAEKNVLGLALGSNVVGRLIDGRSVTGKLTFVGQQSNESTRTYPFEVQVANEAMTLRSGITAEIDIPMGNTRAHKLSPALLGLNDAGETGIRILDDGNRVEFIIVDILQQDRDGIWLAGLPERATVITTGQELVVPGEVVDPVFEPSSGMPAQSGEPKPGPEIQPAKVPDAADVTTITATALNIGKAA
jgi:membrane fusion protein, multidrug efflux system